MECNREKTPKQETHKIQIHSGMNKLSLLQLDNKLLQSIQFKNHLWKIKINPIFKIKEQSTIFKNQMETNPRMLSKRMKKTQAINESFFHYNNFQNSQLIKKIQLYPNTYLLFSLISLPKMTSSNLSFKSITKSSKSFKNILRKEKRKINISRSMKWKFLNSRILNNFVKLSANIHSLSKDKINKIKKGLNKPSKNSFNIFLSTFSFISTKSKKNSRIERSKA